MSILSERDIIAELGKDILIYPFQQENLIGCCLWLTASEYAYSIKLKDLLVIQTDSVSNRKFFNLPKGDTILVWTNESISLSAFFCGSVHSKVSLVVKQIGHIGTKVNPNWSGILVIALHNLSDTDIRIDINETIAYLRFYRLSSKSDSPPDLDSSARLDILPNNPPSKLVNWINDRQNLWRKGSKPDLAKRLRESEQYKKAKGYINQQSKWYWIGLHFKEWAAPIAVSVFILVYLYLLDNQNKDIRDLILVLIPFVYKLVNDRTKTSK